MNFHKTINVHTKDHRLRCRLRQIGLYGLVLLLCLSMATPAYAAGGSENITDGNLVNVDISWGEMQFTYTDEHQLWNPNTHAYDRNVPAGWTAEENWILVQNGENANAVKMTFSSTRRIDTVQGLFRADASTDAGTADYMIELTGGQAQKLWFELTGSITTTYDTIGEILITIIAQ